MWADECRHGHRETGPWHYIDIPLADSRVDVARECPNGDCVIAKTEQFLAVLKNAGVDKDAKTQALKFVIHFVGDSHQPLHVAAKIVLKQRPQRLPRVLRRMAQSTAVTASPAAR